MNFIGNDADLDRAFKRIGAHVTGLEATGKRMQRVGSSLTAGLTLPIVGLAAVSGKMAMDFQASMETLRTQAGASQKQVDQLSKSVLNMAGQVGVAPDELAKGMYHVVSSLNATLPAATRASTELNVLRVAAEGARVGHADLVDVTNALDAAIVSGVKGVQNYSQAMGALNATVGAGDMTMQDLADALSTGLLGPMKTYGLTLTDVSGALAVFGDNNIRGQDAATKLISAVRIMAAPSAAAAKELKGIGLSTLQLANDMRQGGIVQALTDLRTHLTDSGKTAAEQGLVIARAFGGRQSTGVQLLLGQLDRLKSKTAEVSAGAQGFATAWSDTQKTAAQKTAEAVATIKADVVRFGTDVLPTLLSVGSTVVKDVDKVARAFEALPKGAQTAIIEGGLLLATVGPALKILGLFTTGIAKLYALASGKGLAVIGGGGAARGASVAAAGAEGAAGASLASRASGLAGRALGIAGFAFLAAPLALALGAGVAKFIRDSAEKQGKEFTQKFTADLPGKVSQKVKDALKNATTRVPEPLGPSNLSPSDVKHHFSPTQITAISQSDFKALFNQGYAAGQAVVSGLQSVKHPTQWGLLATFTEKLSGLRPTVRNEAAKVMINWAEGLVKNGKLPAKQLDNIIASLENQFPGLGRYLLAQGENTANLIARTMKLTQAQSNWRTALLNFRKDWGDTQISQKITTNNIASNTRQAMADLKLIMKNGTKQQRQAAEAEYQTLRHNVNGTFSNMLGDLQAKQKAMTKTIQGGSRQAAKVGSDNFWQFVSQVQAAEQAGLVSVKDGTNKIGAALNATLKAFGAAKISLPKIAGAVAKIARPALSFAGGFAQGGLVQFGQRGDKGPDTIPVNFGGQNILVGSGEVGAVLTGDQQAFLNARTADVGGLPGVFSKFDRKHHMAQGGLLGNVPAMIARANFDTSLHQPYLWGGGHGSFDNGPWDCSGAVSDILHAGGVLNAPRVSGDFMNYGLPGPGQVTLYANPSHVYMSIDGRFFGTSGSNPGGGAGWFAGSARPGFAVRHIGGGGSGGGGFGSIDVPTVLGKGTMPSIVRAVLGKIGAAANSKLLASVFSGSFGGGNAAETGNWLATAYGPPWGGIQGNGVTATGVDLRGGQQAYIIAADPAALPMHSKVKVNPNPFNYAGAFSVEDTGGAIKGQHIDIYDWLGRGSQDAWGARNVSVTRAARGGLVPFAGSFGGGGTIPGPMGMPSMAIVHGGETVLPAFASGGVIARNPYTGGITNPHAAHQMVKSLFASDMLAQQLRELEIEASKTAATIKGLVGALKDATGAHKKALEQQLADAKQAQSREQSGIVSVLSTLGKIPSQGILGQIQAAGLSNQLQAAQNVGSVPGQQKALQAELALDKQWLSQDQKRLTQLNRSLKNRHLTRKQRGDLLQDKLALLQEIGSIEGDIGSAGSQLSGLASSSTSDTGSSTTDTGATDAQQALTDAINSQAQAMTDLKTTLDAQTAYMKSVGEIEKRQAIKALADVISGQIGGQYYSRATGSAGDGTVARY